MSSSWEDPPAGSGDVLSDKSRSLKVFWNSKGGKQMLVDKSFALPKNSKLDIYHAVHLASVLARSRRIAIAYMHLKWSGRGMTLVCVVSVRLQAIQSVLRF